MRLLRQGHRVLALLAVMLASRSMRAQEEPLCVENSPERRGEIGCSVIETKLLPPDLKEPVFWHIDRFENGDLARRAIGPNSMAFEAHGAWWLMSVEGESNDHHGGQHVAQIKLSPLPIAPSYSMRVLSAYIPSGMTSRVHFHSGVEAIYTVDGEQCVETKDRAIKIEKGQSAVLPTGVTMRLVAVGGQPRRGFGVIVYDSSKPPTTRMPMEQASELVSCAK
jgi:quercetin dioxygenase-like cupin family protein